MIELMRHLDGEVYSPRTYIVAETDALGESKQMNFVLFFYVLAAILFGVLVLTAYLAYLVRHSNKRTNMRRKKVSVLSVIGSGGHTTEMIELMRHLDGEVYSPRTYIVAETDALGESKVRSFESERGGLGYTVERVPRSREVGQSYVTSVFTTIYATYFSLLLVWKYKPDLVLVNGPGTCIPVAFVAAFLDMIRLIDTCIIFEESVCRVDTMSLSGAILYYAGIADDVIVQWGALQEKYPRTVLIDSM